MADAENAQNNVCFSSELIEQFRAAANAGDLVLLAREAGVDLSDEEAGALFRQLHKSAKPSEGELADEGLADVAGGCGSAPAEPIDTCGTCGARDYTVLDVHEYSNPDGRSYSLTTARCNVCGWTNSWQVER